MIKNEIKELSISKGGKDYWKILKDIKEIYEKGKLESTREEYEISLTKNKGNILKKYKISKKIIRYNWIELYEYYPEKIVSNKICFHIHRGVFCLLNANSSFLIPVQLSKLCKIKIISIEIGLAPENKYYNMINNIEKVIKNLY